MCRPDNLTEALRMSPHGRAHLVHSDLLLGGLHFATSTHVDLGHPSRHCATHHSLKLFSRI